MGVVMPKRRAIAATLSKPNCWPSRTATVFTDRAKACRSVIAPRKRPLELRGLQPSIRIGSSTTVVSGVIPSSSATR